MTDRLKGVTVHFERDIREDDAQQVIDAMMMIKGVKKVTPLVADHVDHMARERARHELIGQLWDVLLPERKAQPRSY